MQIQAKFPAPMLPTPRAKPCEPSGDHFCQTVKELGLEAWKGIRPALQGAGVGSAVAVGAGVITARVAALAPPLVPLAVATSMTGGGVAAAWAAYDPRLDDSSMVGSFVAGALAGAAGSMGAFDGMGQAIGLAAGAGAFMLGAAFHEAGAK